MVVKYRAGLNNVPDRREVSPVESGGEAFRVVNIVGAPEVLQRPVGLEGELNGKLDKVLTSVATEGGQRW